MYGIKQPYNEASKKTMDNKNRIFISSGKGSSGFERANQKEFPLIHHSPKFQISRSASIFTIGSCFARNIENSLLRLGIDCLTTKCIIPGEFYELSGLGARNGALNAYTPFSMLELVRLSSIEKEVMFGTLNVGEDEWIDMMMSGLKVLSTEQLLVVRKNLFDTYKTLSTAGVVIITLGYTESWFDSKDNVYVNRSPGSSLRSARFGERYLFHNASAQETVLALEQIVEHIIEITRGEAKIIFTVSPVPLHGTFTERDVICANLYSKCTLVTSAVQVASKYEFVDYFPSYELVSNSEKETSWEPDGIHVKQSVVDKVIAQFHKLYFE